METIEIEKCTVCKSSVIDDIEKGEKNLFWLWNCNARTYGRPWSRSKE